MTQIEDIAKLVFRPGMTEQDFFQQIFAELAVREFAAHKNLTLEETKKWKRKDGICPYTQEWTKGLSLIVSLSGKIGTAKNPARLSEILNKSYNCRRFIHFPDSSDEEKKQMQKAMNTHPQMDIERQGEEPAEPFIWRKPKNRRARHFQNGDFGRFVANADMNPKLIQDLDAFCQKYKCEYKTPEPESWYKRTDTVNVYLYEPMTETMKKEFVEVMKPHIRKSLPQYTNAIDGNFLADGLTCAQEFSQSQLSALIRSAPKHMQAALIKEYVREYPEKDKNGEIKRDTHGKKIVKSYIEMSVGQRKVLEEFLDMYKKYAPKLKANIRVPVQNVTDVKIPTKPTSQQALAPQVPTKPAPQRTPTPPKQSATNSPVDKLKPIRFKIGKTGVSGCKYLDAKGNVIITETYHANCVKRVYANGLTMQMWYNPPSTTYTDGSKTGKAATEIMVTEMGRGCTKEITTSGALKRKIEEVRKAGLLVTALPDSPKRTPTIKGRMMRHSVNSAQTALKHTKGNVSAA